MIKKIFFLKLLLFLNFTIVLCQDIDKIVNNKYILPITLPN